MAIVSQINTSSGIGRVTLTNLREQSRQFLFIFIFYFENEHCVKLKDVQTGAKSRGLSSIYIKLPDHSQISNSISKIDYNLFVSIYPFPLDDSKSCETWPYLFARATNFAV